MHFSPTAPHRFAVTSGTRIQIYSPKTTRVVKTISRFKQVARGGRLRDDGKLVIAGDDTGLVQIFDVNSRAILRTIRAHDQPVHRTLFSPGTATDATVLTASDDATVRLFDVATAEERARFDGHVDYVRTAAYVPSHPSLVVSGSYDGTVRLWDARAPDAELMSMTHGYPVEDVIVHPSGTMAISAGGPLIRVWDLLAGRSRCLKALSNHQKTVTCLTWDGAHRRVLSAGLDGLVKVYDAADGSWTVGHTMRYGGQITSLALSPTDAHLVVGSADGTLSVRRREPKPAELRERQRRKEMLQSGAYEHFVGTSRGVGETHTGAEAEQIGFGGDDATAAAGSDELKVRRPRTKRLREWDRLLKSFRYADALDSVLAKRPNQSPNLAFSLILELIHRDGIHQALAGRDDVGLEPILRFLLKHITDPRYGVTVCDVANVVIGPSTLWSAPLTAQTSTRACSDRRRSSTASSPGSGARSTTRSASSASSSPSVARSTCCSRPMRRSRPDRSHCTASIPCRS